MEVGGHGAADRGLAAADLAGEQADGAQFKQMAQARLGFLARGGSEQVVDIEGGCEGQAGEGEVAPSADQSEQIPCLSNDLIWDPTAGSVAFAVTSIIVFGQQFQ